jgi:hypothetical protein
MGRIIVLSVRTFNMCVHYAKSAREARQAFWGTYLLARHWTPDNLIIVHQGIHRLGVPVQLDDVLEEAGRVDSLAARKPTFVS